MICTVCLCPTKDARLTEVNRGRLYYMSVDSIFKINLFFPQVLCAHGPLTLGLPSGRMRLKVI